jgi:cytochrome d ubiquinol oxidase subunit I
MLDVSAEFLSRLQFAFLIAFHIVFPSITIGLASFLMVLEGFWLKTGHPVYKEIYQFLIKIFAVTFGMGVVTGVVMSYQFGTNWAVFSDKTSNVLGPLFGYEVLTAFFLEAGFLGIMLFGWSRVSNRVHFFATCMVAVGTVISAFWILAASSWMHTPAGFEIRENGLFYPTSWIEVIFNPSFPYRFFHMLFAAYLTTAFVTAGVASYFLRKKKSLKHAKIMLTMAVFFAAILVPVQIFVGDGHGLNTLQYQPAKIAAMEAIWETEKGAPLTIFGWPNEEELKTEYAIKIPKLGSLILTHSLDGEIKGLNEWPKEDRPPVKPVFFGFRIMVGIGFIMLFTAFTGVILFLRKTLFTCGAFHKWCMFVSPLGFVAILSGWIVTEVGRQPYVVYGLLRTSHAASRIAAHDVMFSLILFIIAYSFISSFGLYYIFKLIKSGIKEGEWTNEASDINLNSNSFKQIFVKTYNKV